MTCLPTAEITAGSLGHCRAHGKTPFIPPPLSRRRTADSKTPLVTPKQKCSPHGPVSALTRVHRPSKRYGDMRAPRFRWRSSGLRTALHSWLNETEATREFVRHATADRRYHQGQYGHRRHRLADPRPDLCAKAG